MRKLLVLMVVLLGGCDNPECNGYKLITSDEFQARIVSPDDKYFTLYRTESECGYRYSYEQEDYMFILSDNCMADWHLWSSNNPVILCK